MSTKFVKKATDAIISIVPIEIRKRTSIASCIFVVLIVFAFHCIAVDTSEDTNLNGIISPLESSFELKKIHRSTLVDYGMATLLTLYAICIPVAIWTDDI